MNAPENLGIKVRDDESVINTLKLIIRHASRFANLLVLYYFILDL
jgi:hypothetical protein